VTFTRYIGDHFNLIGETNLGYLTKCGVWLLGGSGINTGTNTPTLRAGIEGTALALGLYYFSTFSYQLLNSRHLLLFKNWTAKVSASLETTKRKTNKIAKISRQSFIQSANGVKMAFHQQRRLLWR
jgi:hypothetical protein